MDRVTGVPNRGVFSRATATAVPGIAAIGKRLAIVSAIILVAATVGRQVALNEQTAVLLVALVIAATAITAPAGMWVIGALVVAIALRGLVTLGLPSVVGFFDIPLAWGALASAILRRRAWSPVARRHVQLLAALSLAVLVSWAFDGSEPVRPLLFLALIGEPFAVLGALLVDPPSPRVRRALAFTAAALVAIQLPIVFWQAHHYGLGDDVAGTLYGAGAGSHVIAGVVALAVLWLFAGRESTKSWHLPALAMLVAVPLLALAKQVLFVLPLALIAMPGSGRGRQGWILRGTLAGAGLFALFYLQPFANEARSTNTFLREAGSGHSGKFAVARVVGQTLTSDPAKLFFGEGPAQTVSRGAFLTTDLLLKEDSPLRRFNLKPAALALEAEREANLLSRVDVPGYGTSFNSGQTSALGVLGDLGVVGAAIYASLVGSVFVALRRTRSGEASAAAAGWVMFALLGFIFDWWEQPPFTLFLAVLSGLALTRTTRPGKSKAAAVVPGAD